MAQMALLKPFLGDVLNANVGARVDTTRNPKRVVQVRAVATKETRVGVLTAAEREVARKRSMRVGDMAEEMKRVRAQMEDDEQLSSLMQGLRGQNLSDTQFATSDTQMRLTEIDGGNGGDESLPLVYDPVTIANYWGKKPAAVATHIAQLVGVAGGFLSGIAMDVITKKIKENEVKRAIELREIVTSLGPAYIKLGQALSIRPDVLSPSAMTELQNLCDKVPSFPTDIAMALLEEEIGKPWMEIYSELSPSPIAAASLGQVYKGRLIENGHLVAVKVQRPYVLETVTIDLFIIRKLGVALRRFPLRHLVTRSQDARDGTGLLFEGADKEPWRVSSYGDQLPNQPETVSGATTIQAEFKSLPDLDYLQELLAIQQSGPRAIGFFGTRNMGFMHQQLIEILSYAMVITKNHIYTSGASGTNAAVIRGALRAEMPELLTVILPQSLKKQPPESQELLAKVKNVIEMPHNDHLPLLEASRLCNMDILSHVQQVICFAFHDSNLLMETCREAKSLRKIVTLFYLD